MKDEEKKQITIKEAVTQLEGARSSTIISYIAVPGAMIEPSDELVLVDNLDSLKPEKGKIKKLDLFLNSYGGFMETAYKLVRICWDYTEEFNVIVPLVAKSAATVICLGAKEIVMTNVAELGPIDPIIQHPYKPNLRVPARAVKDFFEFFDTSDTGKNLNEEVKKRLVEQFDPYLIGVYEGSLKSAKQYSEKLLSEYMLKDEKDKIQDVVEKLTEHYASHGHVIDRKEAKEELGLNVIYPDSDEKLLIAIKQLFGIYNQFMQDNKIVKLQGTRDINRNIQIMPSPQQEIQPPQNNWE
ncbi:MAG: peptidase [Patescibacteria group bacterium]